MVYCKKLLVGGFTRCRLDMFKYNTISKDSGFHTSLIVSG
jgi:hypothetical protein